MAEQRQCRRVSPRNPQGQGFIAATSMKRAGKVVLTADRLMVITPSSMGWRRASRTFLRNSGSFIEEENTVVGQADFPGPGLLSASHHPRVGHGVVRRTEGPHADKGAVPLQEARHGKDLGRLDGLRQRQLGEDAGKPLGQHGFPPRRGADHQDVVSSRGGYLHGPLGLLLPPDLAEIQGRLQALPKQGIQIHPVVCDRPRPGKTVHHVRQNVHRQNVETFHHGCFVCIFTGHDDSRPPGTTHFLGHRQDSLDALDCSVE